MKKLLLSLAAIGLFAMAGNSQVTNMPPGQTFFQSALTYFSSFDTNLTTFHKEQDRIDVFTGPESQQGVGMENLFAIRANLFHPTDGSAIALGGVIRNADIAGTVVSFHGEAAYSMVKYDTKLSFGAGYGYDKPDKRGFAEIFAEISKALTENTYSGLRISHQFPVKGEQPDTPLFCIFVGFTY